MVAGRVGKTEGITIQMITANRKFLQIGVVGKRENPFCKIEREIYFTPARPGCAHMAAASKAASVQIIVVVIPRLDDGHVRD